MKILKVFATLTACFFALAFYAPGGFDLTSNQINSPGIYSATAPPDPIPFSSTVPSDVPNGYNASPSELAVFAWQEFIALNWPAKMNPNPMAGMSAYFRGQASSGNLGSTGSGGVVVWETFHHRVELYPGYPYSTTNQTLPDINAIPAYNYPSYVPIVKPPGLDYTVFNNLDEASEIGLADMYFTPFAQQVDALRQKYGSMPSTAQSNEIEDAAIKAAIVYEAKGNNVIYNYVKQNFYNNLTPRNAAAANTACKINNLPYSGATFEFPSGSIEMKATWRRYDRTMDKLKDYHWTKAIYYTGEPGNGTTTNIANNDTFLLIGLHIIQKTPSFPTFTFATFEHVTDETNGFRFKNTHPGDVTCYSRPLPDDGIRKAIRQFPIPDYLKEINAAVQSQLRASFGNDIVWANYQLVGVQGRVQNDPSPEPIMDPRNAVPAQEFFLSNFATETNDALQFFQGGLGGTFSNIPNPDVAHVFVQDPTTKKYTAYTAGGCSGCHGSQGQLGGFDFSVIAAKGNYFSPEPIEAYPAGVVYDQNPNLFPLPHPSCIKSSPDAPPSCKQH